MRRVNPSRRAGALPLAQSSSSLAAAHDCSCCDGGIALLSCGGAGHMNSWRCWTRDRSFLQGGGCRAYRRPGKPAGEVASRNEFSLLAYLIDMAVLEAWRDATRRI
jgi:hypothetical protein